jgi:hypothetical protein
MPDTQVLAEEGDQTSFNKMTQFFVDMKNHGTNVAFVISVGDMTESMNNSTEWNRVKTAYNILINAQIPFAPCTGNHDGSSGINSAFPVSSFTNRSWSGYGGSHSNKIENSYWNFTADGMNFRIGVLQDAWSTGANARTWLKYALDQGPARRVIFAHHNVAPGNGGCNFINSINNVFLGVSGHDCANNGHTNWVASTPAGETINHCRSDYQCRPNGGAIVRYYLFKPAQNKVFAYTYNVTDRVYETNKWAQFSFSYDMASTPAGTNNSAYVSQVVPAIMVAGTVTNVTIKMKNTGTSTWSPADAQKLGSLGDSNTWGLTRVHLANSVAPNQTNTFSFSITAPTAPGNYSFQWRMVDDEGSNIGWFGAVSALQTITVTPGSVATVVPWVTNLTLSAAGTSITNAGLIVGTVSSNYHATVAAGKIYSQTPGGGVVTNTGSPVNLAVSRGPSTGTTVTFYSVGVHDGYVDESSETSNVGGTNVATLTTGTALRVGDTGARKQRKSIVSFDTSTLPDTAVVTAATLRLKRGGGIGTPTNLGVLTVDIKNVSVGFGTSLNLEKIDFEYAASKSDVGTLSYPATTNAWATAVLNTNGTSRIAKTNHTQFRIRFATDDDNDTADDYLGFYSGENAGSTNRPVLEVTYQ